MAKKKSKESARQRQIRWRKEAAKRWEKFSKQSQASKIGKRVAREIQHIGKTRESLTAEEKAYLAQVVENEKAKARTHREYIRLEKTERETKRRVLGKSGKAKPVRAIAGRTGVDILPPKRAVPKPVLPADYQSWTRDQLASYIEWAKQSEQELEKASIIIAQMRIGYEEIKPQLDEWQFKVLELREKNLDDWYPQLLEIARKYELSSSEAYRYYMFGY